jgi:hypothetical protein
MSVKNAVWLSKPLSRFIRSCTSVMELLMDPRVVLLILRSHMQFSILGDRSKQENRTISPRCPSQTFAASGRPDSSMQPTFFGDLAHADHMHPFCPLTLSNVGGVNMCGCQLLASDARVCMYEVRIGLRRGQARLKLVFCCAAAGSEHEGLNGRANGLRWMDGEMMLEGVKMYLV